MSLRCARNTVSGHRWICDVLSTSQHHHTEESHTWTEDNNLGGDLADDCSFKCFSSFINKKYSGFGISTFFRDSYFLYNSFLNVSSTESSILTTDA